MGRACSTYGERKGLCSVLVGKPEGKRSLGRHRLRWEDTIKKDLQVVGYGGVDWIEMAQGRNRRQACVNAVMNLWVPFSLFLVFLFNPLNPEFNPICYFWHY